MGLFVFISTSVMATLPSIDIDGLTDAAHWVWFEAENASTIYQGGTATYGALSGYRTITPVPNNFVKQEWASGAPSISWIFHAPAAMSSNTKALIACGSHYQRGVDVSVDSNPAGSISTLPYAPWGNPTPSTWVSMNMPALSASDHTLTLTANQGYEVYGWDGVLLYDGDISVSGHPNTVDGSYSMKWMAPSMGANSLPVIRASSITPSFTVTGAQSVSYWIFKDGTTTSYTPGTPINQSGVYRIWAEANGSVWSQDTNVVQDRVLAGADFVLEIHNDVSMLEPDTYLAPGDGDATATSANIGGQIRVILLGKGGPSNRVTDVLVNGNSLNAAFIARTVEGGAYALYSPRVYNGMPSQALLNAGDPIWYRILPMDQGATNTQILIRLRTLPTQSVTVTAVFADESTVQKTISPVSGVVPKLGFVTMNMDHSNIQAYVMLSSGASNISISSIYLDGANVTSSSTIPSGYYTTGVLPLSVSAPGLSEGSYHTLECTLSNNAQVATSFRVINGYSIGVWHWDYSDETSFETFMNDLSTHYINTYVLNSYDLNYEQLAKSYDVTFLPISPNNLDDAKNFANPLSNTYAYYLYDEPDMSDYLTGLTWGLGTGEWDWTHLGLYSQHLVKLAESLRMGDPVHPTFLNLDGNYLPNSYFVYGKLGDISCSDYYYPLVNGGNWNVLNLMYDTAKQHRSGAMPNPTIRLLNASDQSALFNFQDAYRAPFPGEERISAYASIAAGENGLCYFWYHTQYWGGCQYQTNLWAEIADINHEVFCIAPYVSTSFPISLAVTKPANIWLRALAAGTDTLLCVVVNKGYTSTATSFGYNPIQNGCYVTLSLPTGFTISSAVTVTPNGPATISYTQNGNSVTFDVGPMELGRYVLLSTRPNLLTELQGRW